MERKKSERKSMKKAASSKKLRKSSLEEENIRLKADLEVLGARMKELEGVDARVTELEALINKINKANDENAATNSDETAVADNEFNLPENTYSFLMVATYPGENLLCRKKSSPRELSPSGSTRKLGTSETSESARMTMTGSIDENSKGSGTQEDSDVENSGNGKNGDSDVNGNINNKEEKQEATGLNRAADRTRKCCADLRVPFWMGAAVVFLKCFIFAIVLSNSMDWNESGHDVFGFPVDVDIETRMAEVVAIVIAVYTQNDFLDGVQLCHHFFAPLEDHEWLSKTKYIFTFILQLVVGFFGIFVTFVLVMTSTEVKDLLLGFTAMEFVSAQDEIAFELASKGFFGSTLQRKTEKVKSVTVKKKKTGSTWLNSDCVRITSQIFVLVFFFIWFAAIVAAQNNRQIQADNNHITVQMSDLIIPDLATLSGNYYGCRVNHLPQNNIGPIVYISEAVPQADCKSDWKKSGGAFFFCEGESWKFAYGKDGNSLEGVADPCESYSLFSNKQEVQKSDAYDILTHADEVWYAHRTNATMLSASVLDTLIMGPASEKDQAYPKKKEEKDTCDALKPFGLAMDQLFYRRLQGVFVKSRPAFYSLGKEQLDVTTADGEFIVYNGRRWILIKQNKLHDANCDDSLNDVTCYEDYFKGFDPYSSTYNVHLISDPMEPQTEADTWIPTRGLRWHEADDGVPGRGTKPAPKEMSVFEETEYHDFVIENANSGGKDARNKTVVEMARKLFLESSGFECHCHKAEREQDKCKKLDNCGTNSSFVWFEFATDQNPEEFSFRYRYSGTQSFEGKREIIDPAKLQQDGYIELDVGSAGFEFPKLEKHIDNEYRLISFSTCIPESENLCTILSIEDTRDRTGDDSLSSQWISNSSKPGIRAPGRFKFQMFPSNNAIGVRQMEMDGGLAYNNFDCFFGKGCSQWSRGICWYSYIRDSGPCGWGEYIFANFASEENGMGVYDG